MGASGSGTTTLGAALAARLGIPHVDSDDLYWERTEPPFTAPRPLEPRRALLLERAPPTGRWVFSGSSISWAKALEPHYDLIVYLTLDPTPRMARLRRRETLRYGARIEPGGDMEAGSAAFLAWAAAYDSAGPEQRSRAAHADWLANQSAPVLRLDSAAPIDTLLAACLARLSV